MEPHRPETSGLAAGELSVRWQAPYLSDATGKITVLTKDPLSQEMVMAGLHSYLAADSLGELMHMIYNEDEKYRRFRSEQGGERWVT